MRRDRRVASRNILKPPRRIRKCVGDPKASMKPAVAGKLASYKDKQKSLSKCNRLKGLVYTSTRIFPRRLSKSGKFLTKIL